MRLGNGDPGSLSRPRDSGSLSRPAGEGWGEGGIAVAIALAIVAISSSAQAQAVLTPPKAKPPRESATSAWVVWDPEKKREDLIIGARFEGASSPFAWVLPFPSEPEVQKVDEDLRMALSKLITGYQARAPGWRMPPDPPTGARPWIVFGEAGEPRWNLVKASELDAATRLLGLEARQGPIWQEWRERYASQEGWLVGLRVETTAPEVGFGYVRVRFGTDRAYLPYREPAWGDRVEGKAPRLLRVTVIAPEQVGWQIGRSYPTIANAWLSFEPTHDDLRAAFGAKLHAELFDESKRYWLRSFEDWHEIHAGNDDVTFARTGPVPPQGAPGTAKDDKGDGITLDPVGPWVAPRAEDVDAIKPVAAEQKQEQMAAPRRKRNQKQALAFAVMALLALAAVGWATKVERNA